MSDMHAVRIERDGRQKQFGRGAVAEFRRAVMLDLPPDFETGLVRRTRLLDCVENQFALMIGRKRFTELDFAEDIELHGITPRVDCLMALPITGSQSD